MVETTGSVMLRKENVNTTVTGFALQEYKLKNVCTIVSSSAWKETYYQEGAAELTAQAQRNIKGIPRLANFPYGQPNWTRVTNTIEKYGMEGVVSYEDGITDDIDVIARTLLKISRAVVKSVEDEIYNQLSSSYNGGAVVPTDINTFAATVPWDAAGTINNLSGSFVIKDINRAIREVETDNYDLSEGGALLVNPKGYESLMNEVYRLGANAPKMGEIVVGTRKVRTIMDLAIIRSNSVGISGALVLKMKECATWRSVSPLTTDTEYNPGISWRIRAWELGVTQKLNPLSICLIRNTQETA